MSLLLAIDPGNTESAYLVYNTHTRQPVRWAKLPNDDLRHRIHTGMGCHQLAIEMIASYGMSVGAEVFETAVWSGRFIERWLMYGNTTETVTRVFRREVKLHVCGDSRAKDPNIRQALIDRYGPGKDVAIGRKATPGPLYGIAKDVWSALAVAVTVADQQLDDAWAAA